jgi:uncharacterized protein (TIGR02186 family)
MIGRALLLILALALPSRAEEVVLGLSQSRVSISADFVGQEILVFGAIKRDAPVPDSAPIEVIVAVQGPEAAVDMRKKNRLFGIWINTERVEIDSAPTFYAIATTAPFFEILSHTEDLRHRVSIPKGIRSVGAPPEIADSSRFTDALIRLRMNERRYRVQEGTVTLSEDTLFRTTIGLPANLTEGTYRVRIFLTRDRRVLDTHETFIDVRKVGLERFIYTLAHERPLVYGILALMIAISAGWGASAAFGYIRR